MRYLFLLGRNKTLSLCELEVFFRKYQFLGVASSQIHEFFMISAEPSEIPPLERLGGTIKILQVEKENVPKENAKEMLIELLQIHLQEKTTKLKFGLSLFPENIKNSSLLKKLLMDMKKSARAVSRPSRFVNKNFENVSHVMVWNEKLVSDGVDLTALETPHDFMIAKTLAVQNFKAYGLRDYGKPFRDPKSGMLPPKLAQIMINLAVGAKPSKNLTVIDPFCGTGTILMEALLMGLNAVGFDRNPAMIEGAKKNLEWLTKKFPQRDACLRSALGEFSVRQKDATKLTKQDLPEPCAIVTEPWLGPPLGQFPPEEKLKEIMREVEDLYGKFFKNLRNCVSDETPILIVFPYFRDRKKRQEHFISRRLLENFAMLGYHTDAPSNVPLQQGTLLYDREDQIVGREIIKFIAR